MITIKNDSNSKDKLDKPLKALNKESLIKNNINKVDKKILIIDKNSIKDNQNIYKGEEYESNNLLFVEKRDVIIISGLENKLYEVQYIDAIFIGGFDEPFNEIQRTVNIQILKEEKPKLMIGHNNSIKLIYHARKWITQVEKVVKLIIIGKKNLKNSYSLPDSIQL